MRKYDRQKGLEDDTHIQRQRGRPKDRETLRERKRERMRMD